MHNKIVSFLIAILIVGSMFCGSAFAVENQSLANTNQIGGNISQDTVLNRSDNTYVLTSDINIKAGIKLSILDGATVEGNGHKINVYGELIVDQATLNNVNIAVSNTGYQPSAVTISNSSITGGSLFNPTGDSAHAKIILRDNHFKGLKDYSYIWYPSEPVYIERNVFDNCGGLSIGSRVDVYITNNVFVHMTTDYAIENWAQYDDSNCYVKQFLLG